MRAFVLLMLLTVAVLAALAEPVAHGQDVSFALLESPTVAQEELFEAPTFSLLEVTHTGTASGTQDEHTAKASGAQGGPVDNAKGTRSPASTSAGGQDAAATNGDDCQCKPCDCPSCECLTYAGFLDRVRAIGVGQWVVGAVPASSTPIGIVPIFREPVRPGINAGIYRVWVNDAGKVVYRPIEPAVKQTAKMRESDSACPSGRCLQRH